jgi:hypothetical protein
MCRPVVEAVLDAIAVNAVMSARHLNTGRTLAAVDRCSGVSTNARPGPSFQKPRSIVGIRNVVIVIREFEDPR